LIVFHSASICSGIEPRARMRSRGRQRRRFQPPPIPPLPPQPHGTDDATPRAPRPFPRISVAPSTVAFEKHSRASSSTCQGCASTLPTWLFPPSDPRRDHSAKTSAPSTLGLVAGIAGAKGAEDAANLHRGQVYRRTKAETHATAGHARQARAASERKSDQAIGPSFDSLGHTSSLGRRAGPATLCHPPLSQRSKLWHSASFTYRAESSWANGATSGRNLVGPHVAVGLDGVNRPASTRESAAPHDVSQLSSAFDRREGSTSHSRLLGAAVRAYGCHQLAASRTRSTGCGVSSATP